MVAKRAAVWLLWALPLALVVGLAWYQLAGVGSSWEGGEVVVTREESQQLVALGAVPVLWAVLLILLLATPVGRGPLRKGSMIVALVMLPVFGLLMLGDMAFGGRDIDRVRLKDGSVCRLRRSLPAYLLTMEVSRGVLLRRERVLGTGDAEFPALLVRPEAERSVRAGTRSRIVESADGEWLAVVMALSPDEANELASCQTHLVYNRHTGRAYDVEELPEVSPFILVGPRDHLNRADVRALLDRRNRVRAAGLSLVGPSAITIARDLGNGNPEVRKVAADKLDTMGSDSDLEAAAEALEEVVTSSADATAREAARRALGRLRAAQQEGR